MSEIRARYYGDWAGQPGGYREDKTRCIAEVSLKYTVRFGQCERKRGRGPDGLYCTVHARHIAAGRCVKVPQEF